MKRLFAIQFFLIVMIIIVALMTNRVVNGECNIYDKQLLKGESFRPDGYCHKAVCVTTQTADGKEKSGVEWMYDPVVGCKFGRKKEAEEEDNEDYRRAIQRGKFIPARRRRSSRR